mgnify:CR=1 FL=1|jgi:hypothetical protein
MSAVAQVAEAVEQKEIVVLWSQVSGGKYARVHSIYTEEVEECIAAMNENGSMPVLVEDKALTQVVKAMCSTDRNGKIIIPTGEHVTQSVLIAQGRFGMASLICKLSQRKGTAWHACRKWLRKTVSAHVVYDQDLIVLRPIEVAST